MDAPVFGDTHVSASLPSTNFGGLPTINVGNGSTGLLAFDLSTLPVGMTAGIEVQTVNSPWKESAVSAGNQPVTSGAGSSAYYGLAQAGQYMSIDVTAQVKSWITNPSTNFGFALAPAVGAPQARSAPLARRASPGQPAQPAQPAQLGLLVQQVPRGPRDRRASLALRGRKVRRVRQARPGQSARQVRTERPARPARPAAPVWSPARTLAAPSPAPWPIPQPSTSLSSSGRRRPWSPRGRSA